MNSLTPRPYVSFNFEGVGLRLENCRMVHTCREDLVVSREVAPLGLVSRRVSSVRHLWMCSTGAAERE